jgi:hypothetical protein
VGGRKKKPRRINAEAFCVFIVYIGGGGGVSIEPMVTSDDVDASDPSARGTNTVTFTFCPAAPATSLKHVGLSVSNEPVASPVTLKLAHAVPWLG